MGLIDELVFYGSYHNNKWNQLIHFLFVPSILWSAYVLLQQTPAIVTNASQYLPIWTPGYIVENFELNFVFLHWALTGTYYCYLVCPNCFVHHLFSRAL